MAEFPGIPKDYLTVSFLQQLKEYIDDKAAEGGGGGGGGGSGLVVNVTEEEETHDLVCDKTWQEMWDVAESGSCIIVHLPNSIEWGLVEMYEPWTSITPGADSDYFLFVSLDGEVYGFVAGTQDGYPRCEPQNPDNNDPDS